MSGYGMKGHVMVNFQDSMGTAQTSSLQAVPITEEGLVHSIEQITEANMFARYGESPYHEGAHTVEGDVSLESNPTAIGWFLKSAFGFNSTTTTSDSGLQSHVFVPATSDFDCRAPVDPMTIETYRDVGSAALYYDLFCNNLTLNVANGQLLTMTAAMMGSGFSRKANATPVYDIAPPFIWDQASASYNGAAVTDLRDLTVTFNNNFEAVHTLTGSKAPHRYRRTAHQVVEVTGNMVFASESYMQAFEAQSEQSFVVHFSNATSPHAFTMDFSKLRFKNFEPTMAGPGLIEASFTAGAMFDTTSNRACTFTLVNTQTYY